MRTDAGARLGEVLVDVGAQRLQRRDVDDADFVGQRRGGRLLHQIVDRGEKRRERLAGSGRRGNQRVAPSRIAAQPSACARVGSPSVSENHCETMGWNADNAMKPPGAVLG